MLDGFENKSATAVSIIGYMGPELEEPVLFIGRTEGRIVSPRGNNELGW
jgi:inosine triphosphate pyrophosphatase